MHVVFYETNPFAPREEVSCDDDIIDNLDELTFEDPQLIRDQVKPKEDPLKVLEDEVELQEQQV